MKPLMFINNSFLSILLMGLISMPAFAQINAGDGGPIDPDGGGGTIATSVHETVNLYGHVGLAGLGAESAMIDLSGSMTVNRPVDIASGDVFTITSLTLFGTDAYLGEITFTLDESGSTSSGGLTNVMYYPFTGEVGAAESVFNLFLALNADRFGAHTLTNSESVRIKSHNGSGTMSVPFEDNSNTWGLSSTGIGGESTSPIEFTDSCRPGCSMSLIPYMLTDLSLTTEAPISNVPLPPALWLFGSALIGLAGIKRKK